MYSEVDWELPVSCDWTPLAMLPCIWLPLLFMPKPRPAPMLPPLTLPLLLRPPIDMLPALVGNMPG